MPPTLTNLGSLPPRGALYIGLGVKAIDQSGARAAIAFVPNNWPAKGARAPFGE